MSSEGPRFGRKLTWCLRHFGWVALACLLVGAAVPLLVVQPERTYQAESVVIARQVADTIHPRVLPSLAEAVFAHGEVADAVAADPMLGPLVAGETGGLVPETLSVVAGPDSVTMVVQARHANPAIAKQIADVAAIAYAAKLNETGSGVGEFSVLGDAVQPTTPVDTVSYPLQAGLGALAGLVLGLGLIALIAALRQPIVTSADVKEAVDVPLLGVVELPRVRPGTYLGARGVRGIAAVTRWLATAPPGRLTLISSRSAEGMRHRIYVMVAIAMSTVRPVRLKAPPEIVDAVRAQSPRADDGDPERRPDAAGELFLVDGGSPSEIVDPAAAPVYVIAVAPLGISPQRLRDLGLDYLDGGLLGVILVKRRLGLRRRRGFARTSAPKSRALRPARDMPAPEAA